MPYEWSGVAVPVFGPLVDGVGEFSHGSVGASAYVFGGEFGEPSLHEVHPRRVGGGEMEREAGVALQPALYGRSFVGGGVVQDDVYLQVGGYFTVDEVEEPAELF